VHTTAHKDRMHLLKKVTGDDSITMGNGIAEKAALIGELTGTICHKNGEELTTATVLDVVYLPTGQFNLFSLTKMTTNQGRILGGDDKGIWLTKGGQKLLFDIVIPTPKGMLFAMYIKREIGKEMAQTMVDENSIPIQLAHDRLGHSHKDMTRKMAKELGRTLSRGSLKPCGGCLAGKAKQRMFQRKATMWLQRNQTRQESSLTSRKSRNLKENQEASTSRTGGLSRIQICWSWTGRRV
jgi:hypothetical protein